MISDLSIALVQCSEVSDTLEETYTRIHQVTSLKDLVSLLIDQPIDVIVCSAKKNSKEKIQKIYDKYQVPILIHDQATHGGTCFLSGDPKTQSLDEIIEKNEVLISSARVSRENIRLQHLVQKSKTFVDQVIHSTKEMFINETKKFFKNNFKIKRCHWVEVKKTSSKLPPILKLRNELEKQKVDQGSLIAELDACTEEVSTSERFQIWKTHAGHYMAFLWVSGPVGYMQCVVLNHFKMENRIEMEMFLEQMSSFMHRRWKLCLSVEEAQEQIYKDSLTDLYNQKFLGEVIDKKIEENKRYKTPFSVLFIDVDHFKRVNDSLGHVIGSGVLTLMGDLLKKQIRNSDYAFRYGGDEFIILLSHTEGQDAVNVAERVRETVENHSFDVNKVKVKITVSIGLAFYPEHAQSAEEIIRIADEAMYYGKNKSRNIVYKAG